MVKIVGTASSPILVCSDRTVSTSTSATGFLCRCAERHPQPRPATPSFTAGLSSDALRIRRPNPTQGARPSGLQRYARLEARVMNPALLHVPISSSLKINKRQIVASVMSDFLEVAHRDDGKNR